MKTRNKLMIIAALCCAAFVLGACSYEDGSSGQGSIRISFDNSNARHALVDSDKPTIIYTITLTSPGKDTREEITEKGVTSTRIEAVPEGNWHIKVQAVGDRVRGEGETINDVEVKAGESADADITMAIIGTRVSSWGQLVTDFQDETLPNHSIEILNSFDTIQSQPLELKIKKTITLWAKQPVTITRSEHMLDKPVFTIENCTLILDGTQGGITIDGNRDEINKTNRNSSRALINVEANSTLEILGEVTITNNISYSSSTSNGGLGGGIYVNNRGTFNMKGGTISNNRASTSGGGVHIVTGGTFTKTGGTIYGNDAEDSDRNLVISSSGQPRTGSGHAVYYSATKLSDLTLGEDQNWSNLP